MTIETAIAIDRPRALLVTNDGDRDDADEQLVVSQYVGIPVAGGEARDDGRTGQVSTFSLGGLAKAKDITLSPFASGFHAGGIDANPIVTTSPNQLTSAR